MAFNAQGFWTPDDDNAATAVANVMSAGGPMMKQARTAGLQSAAKRGLANSSMAVGAAQDSVIRTAAPIGMQNASQTHEKNLAALNATNQYRYGMDMAKFEADAAKDRLGMQITSTEKLSANEISARMNELNTRIAGDKALAAQGDAAAMARLQADLGSRTQLQSQQLASQKEQLGMELGARMSELDKRIAGDKALAAQGDAAAQQRLQMDLASRAQLQSQADASTLLRQREELAARADLGAAERAARLAEVEKQLASTLQIANLDASARQKLVETEGRQAMDRSVLDANTRLDLADREAATQAQRLALDASTNATNAYMQAMGQSMLNENIPADVRAAYQQSLQAATQSNLALVNQITGSNLKWGSTAGPTNPGGATPTVPPPAPPAYNPSPLTPPQGLSTTSQDIRQQADGRLITYVNGSAIGLFNPATGKTTPFSSDAVYSSSQGGNVTYNPNWNGNLA